MEQMRERLKKGRLFVQQNAILALIIAFFVLEAISLMILSQSTVNDPVDLLVRRGPVISQEAVIPVSKNIPKLSEIRGPRIDNEAAMIVIQDETKEATPASSCFTLPVEMWVFVFLMYTALIIFNLAYGFDRPAHTHTIQWFWETLYTLLFIVGWYVWDECRMQVWFPLAIVKTGLFVYAVYLYFFERRK